MADFQGDGYDPTAAPIAYDIPGGEDYDDDEEEDDDYDPSNLQFQQEASVHASHDTEASESTVQPTIVESSQPTKPKQRTLGGFVVDDDDDDEEEEETPMDIEKDNAAAESAVDMQQRSVTQTPVNTAVVPAPDTTASIENAAASSSSDQGSSGATVPAASTNNKPVPENGVATPIVPSGGSAFTAPTALTPAQTPLPVSNVTAPPSTAVPLPKARLPQDRVGILEDRIAEDPRGDTDAWFSLIEEHKLRNKIEEVYETYDRFFKVFPQAGDQWAAYIQTMMQNEDTKKAEAAFGKVLLTVPHVRCWSLYIDYIRRMNNLATDTTGKARSTINSAFEFTLNHIGQDPAAQPLWQDYINFTKSMPGNTVGDGWQDKQKVDTMRKVYRQALSIPMPGMLQLWGEYTNFELTASRINGRKFQNEQMPAYMTAKQAYIALENKIQHLNRSTVPKLPPVPGYDGFEEYHLLVQTWRDWIDWEKEDQLVLKDDKDKPDGFKNRVLFVYKLALMSLRFEPRLWYDAIQFCVNNEMKDEGDKLLSQALEANPESCLLAFMQADGIETQTAGESDATVRGEKVGQPYRKVINTYYDIIKRSKERSDKEVAQIQERYAQEARQGNQREQSVDSDENDADEDAARAKEATDREQAEIQLVQQRQAEENLELRRLLTSAWVALIRAMRRIQGKGKPGSDAPGSRGILSELRKRGSIISDLYVQCALTEWYCYKDPAAYRLFDKGMQLYPTDEAFALEYIRFLTNLSDLSNARTIFEKAVGKLEKEKAKPLYYFFHSFESRYGELAQIQKLEQRMHDLYPEDPTLQVFAHRFESEAALQKRFDPTSFLPVISPNTQMRERTGILPSIENDHVQNHLQATGLPHISIGGTNSPKRPYVADGGADGPPRKLARGESPLKGAAGRRVMDSTRRRAGNTPTAVTPGWTVPRDVNFVLSVLPNARFATNLTPSLDSNALVNVLRTVDLQPHLWNHINLRTAGRGLMDPQYHLTVPPVPHPAQQAANARPMPPQQQAPPTPTFHQPPQPHMSMPPQQYYAPPPTGTPQYGYQPPPNGQYAPPPAQMHHQYR